MRLNTWSGTESYCVLVDELFLGETSYGILFTVVLLEKGFTAKPNYFYHLSLCARFTKEKGFTWTLCDLNGHWIILCQLDKFSDQDFAKKSSRHSSHSG